MVRLDVAGEVRHVEHAGRGRAATLGRLLPKNVRVNVTHTRETGKVHNRGVSDMSSQTEVGQSIKTPITTENLFSLCQLQIPMSMRSCPDKTVCSDATPAGLYTQNPSGTEVTFDLERDADRDPERPRLLGAPSLGYSKERQEHPCRHTQRRKDRERT